MEVTALCIRQLMTVLLLLIVQVDFSCSQTADEAFPQVVPNRQQLFELDPIEVSCEGLEGLTGWRVMKKIKDKDVQTCIPEWTKSTGPCKITNTYQTSDSGQYWCEMGGKKSNIINITVTAGSVILESPVHPVKQGDAVTLYCKNKTISSNITAEFSKNGHVMESRSTGNLTIESFSTSNEGLYTCKISGDESRGSWLTVRAPSSHHALQLSLLLWIGLGVLALLLLLLVVLLACRKRQPNIRDTTTASYSCQSSSSPQTVSEEASEAAPIYTEATYALVTKPKKKKDDESLHHPVYHTLSLGKD
ncbi:uncharacterized protein LOC119026887 isoform X2 [Acanthopagrus latus]|uniref:uncharacterized protein LOC119026887 isoform X2 n=1 Tax=Acanthopagrus latus TaxID=8177 RepID=UPI00187BD2AE|nr:uncharacterized protein LOC119026887 isoform X2 [Acanthopagrus latus]